MSIRINLLADVGQEISPSHRTEGVLASALLVASLGTFGSMYTAQSSQAQTLITQQGHLESELGPLREHAAALLSSQQEQAQMEEKINLIQELMSSQSRVRAVRILDDLSVHTPEFAWLTEFAERAGSARLEGWAVDNQTVASFAHNLTQSAYFENIKIHETVREQAPAGASSLTHFVIESGVTDGPSAGLADEAAERQSTQEKADQLREFIEQTR